MRRLVLTSAGGLVVLTGVLVVAAVLLRHRGPTEWLDDNLTRTDDDTWFSSEPPLVTADRLAEAVTPGSQVVSSWGVALRYAEGTVSVVAGPHAGTANVYWDVETADAVRHYRFGRQA